MSNRSLYPNHESEDYLFSEAVRLAQSSAYIIDIHKVITRDFNLNFIDRVKYITNSNKLIARLVEIRGK